jgi:DNA-binding NarL/FixJ family response regulator
VRTRSAVVLDRQPLWLEGIEVVLARADVVIVGKTTSNERAIALLAEHKPDLFVVSIESEEDLTNVRRAGEVHPAVKTVALSLSDDSTSIQAAFTAGVSAYVVKTALPEDLAFAVRQAFTHSLYLAARPGTRANQTPNDSRLALTKRQVAILRLVADGLSNSQVAHKLTMSDHTVKAHLSQIYRRLGVTNRTEASHQAHAQGWL